jgi:branched-chain amino acid transport system permease protein
MEFITARFPNHSSVVIGITFLAIVYLLPEGITGRIEGMRDRIRRRAAAGTGIEAPEAIEEKAA